MLFFTIVIISLAALVLVPRKFILHLGVLLFSFLGLVQIELNRFYIDASTGSGFGAAIIALFMYAIIAAYILRLATSLLLRDEDLTSETYKEIWSIVLGVPLGGLLFLVLWQIFYRAGSALAVWAFIISAGIVVLLLLRRYGGRLVLWSDSPRLHIMLGRASFAGFIASVVFMALFSANTVARNAQLVAQDQPYCILVADGAYYRPASSLQDLSLLTMWGDAHSFNKNWMYANAHALLVLSDGATYNWSYHKRSFVPSERHNEPLQCRLHKNYAENLEWVAEQGASPRFVILEGQEFLIAEEYRPRISAAIYPGSRVSFATKGFDYQPDDTPFINAAIVADPEQKAWEQGLHKATDFIQEPDDTLRYINCWDNKCQQNLWRNHIFYQFSYPIGGDVSAVEQSERFLSIITTGRVSAEK